MTQNGKVYFITGASRGLGATLARVALAAGHQVVATGRDVPAIEKALGGASPSLLAVRLDVTQETEAQAAVKAAVERFGRIDVLVNNAGYGQLGRIEEVSSADVDAQFRTNVFGLLHVTRAVLPYLRAQRSGHIFNISSLAGYIGVAEGGIYCATKFAVEAISETLGEELKPFGVRVTTIGPGYFRTEFLESNSIRYPATEIEAYGPSRREQYEAKNGHQEGDPAKLSKIILQLAEEENPPLRFPAGPDAVAELGGKIKSLQAELEQWSDLGSSTNFDS